MKTVVLIQARMGSTRLPGKVLKPLGGKPVLQHIVERLRQCQNADEIVVATTTNPIDEAIVHCCLQWKVPIFRGSETDVLQRFYLAAKQFQADVVVRVTADCPLVDPEIVDSMIYALRGAISIGEKVDYISNTQKRTFPRGFDSEVFTFNALEKAHLEAKLDYEREHVTPFIYRHPELFVCRDFVNPQDYSQYRLTLDTPEDYQLLSLVFEAGSKKNMFLKFSEVIVILQDNPEWIKINAHIEQKTI